MDVSVNEFSLGTFSFSLLSRIRYISLFVVFFPSMSIASTCTGIWSLAFILIFLLNWWWKTRQILYINIRCVFTCCVLVILPVKLKIRRANFWICWDLFCFLSISQLIRDVHLCVRKNEKRDLKEQTANKQKAKEMFQMS